MDLNAVERACAAPKADQDHVDTVWAAATAFESALRAAREAGLYVETTIDNEALVIGVRVERHFTPRPAEIGFGYDPAVVTEAQARRSTAYDVPRSPEVIEHEALHDSTAYAGRSPAATGTDAGRADG
jgi:hypothetical protein